MLVFCSSTQGFDSAKSVRFGADQIIGQHLSTFVHFFGICPLFVHFCPLLILPPNEPSFVRFLSTFVHFYICHLPEPSCIHFCLLLCFPPNLSHLLFVFVRFVGFCPLLFLPPKLSHLLSGSILPAKLSHILSVFSRLLSTFIFAT